MTASRWLHPAGSAAALVLAFLGLWLTLPSPRVDGPLDLEPLAMVMDHLGLGGTDHRTVIFGHTRDVPLPARALWSQFVETDRWPEWSGAGVAAIRWRTAERWQIGAQFDQTVMMGFPFGAITTAATVERFSPGRHALWFHEARGLRGAQVWFFQELPDGGTRLTAVEVIRGWRVALIKPLVADVWQRRMANALDGLVERTRLAPATPAPAPAP